MSLNEQDISLIIAKVRQEIDSRGDQKSDLSREKRTVVLIPSFVPSPDRALAALREHYSAALELVFLSPVVFPADGVKTRQLDWKAQPNEIVDLLVNAETLVLLAPSTGFLRRLGGGQEEEGIGELLLRRLLWGKTFDVLMDFTTPKFRRSTTYADIAEAIDTLSSTGVRFRTYRPVDSPAQDGRVLVTEQDVVDAKRCGLKTIACAKDAIITPLAADTARELQINIQRA